MPDTDPETHEEEANEQPRWPEDEPFAQCMPGESTAWLSRFASYCMQGPTRSVRDVYRLERGNAESRSVPGSWTKASHTWQWRKRAAEYDAWQRKALFTRGMASDTVRVRKLNELAKRMHERLIERLDTVDVNDKFIGQYLAVLDLLAKHTGGYGPQRIEHTGKDGGKIEVNETETKLNVWWYMPKIDELPLGTESGTEVKNVQGDGGAGQISSDANQ